MRHRTAAPADVPLLCGNPAAVAFYRELGYADYSLTMEIMPMKAAAP